MVIYLSLEFGTLNRYNGFKIALDTALLGVFETRFETYQCSMYRFKHFEPKNNFLDLLTWTWVKAHLTLIECAHLTFPPYILSVQVKSESSSITGQLGRFQNKIK